MPNCTGVVVGYDDYLPEGAWPKHHEFHVIVKEGTTGRLMRLRARSFENIPLRLEHFGEVPDMTEFDHLNEIRWRLAIGATISFDYSVVWDRKNAHELDVMVLDPANIERGEDVVAPRGIVYNLADYQLRRAAR